MASGFLKKKRRGSAPNPANASVAADYTGDSQGASDSEKGRLSSSNEQQTHVVTTEENVDSALEKRLVRKFDLHVVSLVFALYILAFLDRSNIGNARIAGMSKDLHLYGDRYDWFLTIFYIAYIIAEPTVIFYKLFKPHHWLAIVTFFWGVFATVQAGAPNWSAMMAFRFLMGVFEAGFGPGIPYLLSFFYLRHELGLRAGMFLSAAPLATCFSGALAYGITSGHVSIANWRLLFLVEGLPTICMTPIAFFFMPDTPQQARFLNTDEKKLAVARGVRQTGSERKIGNINLADLGKTVLDLKAWLTALMYFSCNVSFSSLPVFLPTIILEMGFNSIDAQGLSAPQYFISFLITIGSSWVADKTRQRGFMIMFLSAAGGVGYVVLAASKNVGARYFATFLAAGGVFPSIANILPWVMNNQGNDTRRGGSTILLNLVGQCGPILGTRVYPSTDGPFYVKGQSVCAAFMFFTTILAFALRTLNAWENKKLDQQFGRLEELREEVVDSQWGGEDDYGPRFRYIL